MGDLRGGMNEQSWPPKEPPPEAYSRVTNPERFLPLRGVALTLVARLSAAYEVAQADVFDLLPGMQPFEHARPPVALVPAASGAAPIAIAFTTFPSLVVRYGRWRAEDFPSCGCDACGETAEEEGERLEQVLGDVVAGHFREELTIPLFGEARLGWALGDVAARAGRHRGGVRVLPRDLARALRGRGPDRVHWRPWAPRVRGAAAGALAV